MNVITTYLIYTQVVEMFVLLLSVAMLLHIVTAKVYYVNVTPDENDLINSNDTDSAKSLEYYLKNTSEYFSSDSQFHFKIRYHYLNTDLVIQNVTNVTLTGESLCIIRCTSHVGIIILNVTNFRLENITFENCSANYSNHLHTDFRYHYTFISNASILLYHCMSVDINNITIIIPEGNVGLLVINVRNYLKITNIHIAIQINCPSVNIKSALQTNGILLYCDNWNNPNNKSSEIQLDNFQFTTNGSCSHPTYYAIKSSLLQNNTNVSIVIQNTMFTDLINVTALYYYGETCGITVSNILTIRNCVVSNNTGNYSFKMFHIKLNNIQCIWLISPKQLFCRQQHNEIRFINCKFENNINVTSMIYVSPASTRATTFYLYLENNKIHNNRNSHFLIMKSDTDNIWMLSSYVVINKTIITSNVHDEGQDLMSFTNSWVRFIGHILILGNHYYTNICNFYLSSCILQHSIDISNNTARKILSGSFIVLRENTTITLTRNSVYILMDQVLTYSMNFEPFCAVQFYTGFDIYDVSKLLSHVTISDNIHMISKNLPNYDFKCRWLAGYAFQKSGLTPDFVFGKLVQIENNTVISNDKKRPIPLSICKCTNPSLSTGAKYNDIDHDCYSTHLGTIFPGQTLIVELIINKQWLLHNVSSINIVVHNRENDNCSVVDTFQLSQTHLNQECNNYNYTLWPKMKTLLYVSFSLVYKMYQKCFMYNSNLAH